MYKNYSVTVNDLTSEEAVALINDLSGATVSTTVNNVVNATATPPVNSAAVYSTGTTPSPVAAPVSVPTPIATASSGDVDTNGIPHDKRIHAGSKTKNADGQWKRRKGVTEEEVATVTAELKGSAPAPTASFTPPVNPMTITPPAPMAAPAPIPAAPTAPARDFQGLMQHISVLFASKRIAPEYPNTIVDRVKQGFGVNLATISDIANDLRMVEYAWQCLDVDGLAA